MSPSRWADLDRRERRGEIVGTVATVTITWVALLGVYYLVPFTDRASGESVVRLVVGIVAFVGVLVWQLGRVKQDEIPELRAIQALGVTIPVFLMVFAVLYLSLSEASSSHFSEPLDHSAALYFVVTIFSTVGFGDITPEGGLAQLLVSIQMLLDLVVIGAVVRLLVNAAKSSLDG
jgi:voltage-gated potassium channel